MGMRVGGAGRVFLGAVVAATLFAPGPVRGQVLEERLDSIPDPVPQVVPPPPPGSGPVVAVPGAEYAASGFRRFLVGPGHRELWATPHEIPVLDLATFGGGLEPENRGGGSQSITLHMMAPDGREYHFRTVNKWSHQGLPKDLQLTPAGWIIQDQIGALHPGGAMAIPPLLEAAGILHATPRLVVMPDDPRLGEFRETFAGMVGIIEEMPNEGEDDEPLFAGSRTVAGMDRLLEHLEEDPGHRANARAYLKARLVDLLVGDMDRGADNWRAARYGEEGRYLWEPIPRDRDWVFHRIGGLVGELSKYIYPKLTSFDEDVELSPLLRSSHGQDRVLLAELPREAWDSVAVELQADLTDEVLRKTARSLPPEQAALQADEMERLLRIRREALRGLAHDWYETISTEVNVRATDGGDRAEIERFDDGTVRVILLWPVDAEGRALPPEDEDDEDDEDALSRADTAGWAPYFTRRFLPAETREVRVYLHGGDDRAIVRGRGPDDMRIRVIGGGGDDELVDSSTVAGRAGAGTTFHDARGDNRFEPGAHTGVDTRRWEEPGSPNWITERAGDEDYRDWGGNDGWGATIGYSDVAGPILGASRTWTGYGFRQVPWSRQLRLEGRVGVLNGGVGLDASFGTRRPNSRVWFAVDGEGSTLETLRFHGFGNDTPLGPDPELHQAEEHLVLLRGAVHREWGDKWKPSGTVTLAPEIRYTEPQVVRGSALDLVRPSGADGFGQVGIRVDGLLDRARGGALPTGGFALQGGASTFAPVWDAPGWFGDVHGRARAWLELADPVTLFFQAGGERVWGDFPVHEAAFLGGQESLRGFRYRRFAGDAAVHGNAELRVRLAELTLFTRGRLGVTALTDAGRVWMDGTSEGSWHLGHGAGVWFESLGAVLRLTWARGEEDRIYAGLGISF